MNVEFRFWKHADDEGNELLSSFTAEDAQHVPRIGEGVILPNDQNGIVIEVQWFYTSGGQANVIVVLE